VASSSKLNTSQNAKLTSGLVGEWSFNGADISGTTATDRSGSGNNGTLTNGPVVTNGKIGQALSFDGVNDYVSVGDVSALKFTSGDFSFGLWLYSTGTLGLPFGKGNTGVFSPYLLYPSAGTLKIAIGNSAGSAWLTTTDLSATITNNVWTHIFFTKAGAVIRLYKNGVQTNVFTMASATILNNTLPVRIGADSNAGSPWNGSIDDVRIYNRALSATEVKRLYNMGR